jgi:hypothetical protein
MILVGSSALCGFTLYLLVKYLTKNTAAALLAGSMWMMSYSHITQAYIQLLPLWWLPLIFLIAEKIRRGEWKRRIWWLSVVIFMQLTVGIYVAMYSVISFSIYVAILGLFKMINKDVLIKYIKAWLVAGLIAIPIYAPSLILNFARPTVRGLNEQASLSWSNIYPIRAPGVLWQRALIKLGHPPGPDLAYYTLGILMSVLVVIGIGYGIYRLVKLKKLSRAHALPIAFLVIGLFSLAAALGPYIYLPGGHRVYNVVFLVPYIILPGFKVMRLALRWQFIAIFGLAIFSSYFVAKLLLPLRAWKQLLIAIAAIAFIFVEQAPWNSVGGHTAPKLSDEPVYEWLSKQPGTFAIAELPIYPGVYVKENDEMEGKRLYYQTMSGWHPRVSGAYSPFIPKAYPSKASTYNSLGEDQKAIQELKRINVKYVLFFPEDYETLGWGKAAADSKKALLDRVSYLKTVFTSSKGTVYEVIY